MANRRAPRRRAAGSAAARPGRKTTAGIVGVRYLESSALVAALLEHDTAAMAPPTPGTLLVTSALTLAETGRAIVRARATARLTAADERRAVLALRTFERRCFVVDVGTEVLARVRRPFPVEPVRTLDAVHLATVELLADAPQLITVVTRDERVRRNAQALGFMVE